MSDQDSVPAPKLKMVFRVRTWSLKSKVNRSGREEGESIVMWGHVYAPTIDANTPLSKARGVARLKSAQDRMSVKIGKEETEILLPLEDFAMERITAKIKELSGHFGLSLSVEFEANETTDRQVFEAAEFTFTKTDPAASRPAAAAPAAPATQAPAAAQPVTR